MSEDTGEEFLTKDQARLTRIASIANILAWIVLVVQILSVAFTFIKTISYYSISVQEYGSNPDFFNMLMNNPLEYARFVIDLVNGLLHGAMYWLVLKGVSAGLYMIAETNLNHAERELGEGNG